MSVWQLRALGWSRGKVRHHAAARGWRRVHPGVYVLNSAPLTRVQLWFAAVLTAPGTVLSHGSAGACFGFHRFEQPYEVVTRPGRGGRRRQGGVLVFRSAVPDAEVTRHMGIPVTRAERVLVDLAAGLDDRRLGRAFRESVRLKATTARRVLDSVRLHQGQPGTARLGALATRYRKLPYARTRSDAEGRALEVLHDAGRPAPRVNVRIAGEEADLAWDGLIVEIDGPQYHQFRQEDARKEAAWRAAGYVVRRISSDAVYARPEELLALAP